MELKALVYAQSGGPTSVINASAYGVIREGQARGYRVLAAIGGIEGILNESLVDLADEDDEQIELLKHTPAAAFGSCRKKMPRFEQDASPYEAILKIFRKYNVKCFVYNGGNDSMNTCAKIAAFFARNHYDCNVMGVPKTIDNDLLGTDHAPGYGSAAKMIATTMREIALDTSVYAKGRVTVVEIMGRDAGWLTASGALSLVGGPGPDLVYVPEIPFDTDSFLRACKSIYDTKQTCLVAVSEGIRDKDGSYVCSQAKTDGKDAFNNIQLGGVGIYLASKITQETGIKTRAIELSLMQRCAAHIASLTDVQEAEQVGRHAVAFADEGMSGKMVTILRTQSPNYEATYGVAELALVASGTQSMPAAFLSEDGCHVTQAYLDYALPLIAGETVQTYQNGLPVYANLKKRFITK